MEYIEISAKTVDDAITEAVINWGQPMIRLNMK